MAAHVVGGDLLQGFRLPDGGVVHQRVEAAEMPMGLGHHAARGGFVGQVGRQRDRFVATGGQLGGRGLGAAAGIVRVQGEAVAVRRQMTGKRVAEPPAGAGDQCDGVIDDR